MSFLVCLIVVAAFTLKGNKFIKKNYKILYIISILLAAFVAVGTAMGIHSSLPGLFTKIVWEPVERGSLATAFFVMVMYAGAVKNGSVVQKKIMPIRGELSIIACILTLGHNISAGQVYFVWLFTEPSKLPPNQIAAAIMSLIMIVIMIPLFITSFKTVRKKMNPRSWKKLQRLAYIFYALTYVHIILLSYPRAQQGNPVTIFNIVVFTVVFLVYGALRAMKAMKAKNMSAAKAPAVIAVVVAVCVGVLCMPRATEAEVMTADGEVFTADGEAEVFTADPEDLEEAGEDASDEEKDQDDKKDKDDRHDKDKDDKKDHMDKKDDKKDGKDKHDKKPESAKPAHQEHKPEPAKPAPPPAPTTVYKNGTFSGTGSGYAGPITVSVSINNDVITGVSVTSHQEDEPFWSEAKGITGSIVSAQSANVSSVSGATSSCEGIKQAVNAALASARN